MSEVRSIDMPIPSQEGDGDSIRRRDEESSQGAYLKPEDLKEGMRVRRPGSDIVYEIDQVGDISGAVGTYYLRDLSGKQAGVVNFLDNHPLFRVEE